MMELPEPLHAITSRPVTWPTVGGSNAPGSVPVHALPVLVHNNIQLANKPASPPPHPTIAQTLTALPLSLQFSFNQVTLPIGATNVISSYRVYRNTSANNFSGATLMRTFVHDPTRQGAITVQDNTGGGKTYYYFVTSVDTASNESTAVGAQSGAIVSQNANPTTASAVGSTSNPSTVSASYVVIPEMTVTATFKGNKVIIVFTGSFGITTVSTTLVTTGEFAIFKDGAQLTPSPGYFITNGANVSTSVPSTGLDIPVSISFLDQPSAASHTYDVRWAIFNGPGTLNGIGTARTLQVVELG